MYHLLIVEDDTEQRNALEHIIHNKYPEVAIHKSSTYSEAVDLLKNSETEFSFFFLDVDLGEGDAQNGLALGRYIRLFPAYLHTPIIYVTSFDQYVFYALNSLHCSYYLVKPYLAEHVIKSIQDLLVSPLAPPVLLECTDIDGISFNIAENDIIYVKANAKHIIIHTLYDSITTRQYSIRSLETVLKSRKIVKCHKSALVNLDYLESFDKTNMLLHLKCPTNQPKTIPVGRTYKNQFIERMKELYV